MLCPHLDPPSSFAPLPFPFLLSITITLQYALTRHTGTQNVPVPYTRQLYALAACSAQLHTSYSLAARALNRSTALPQVCRDRHHVNGPRHGPQVAHNAVERWRGIGGSASALSVRHPSRSSTSSRRAACARARRLQLKLPWYPLEPVSYTNGSHDRMSTCLVVDAMQLSILSDLVHRQELQSTDSC